MDDGDTEVVQFCFDRGATNSMEIVVRAVTKRYDDIVDLALERLCVDDDDSFLGGNEWVEWCGEQMREAAAGGYEYIMMTFYYHMSEILENGDESLAEADACLANAREVLDSSEEPATSESESEESESEAEE